MDSLIISVISAAAAVAAAIVAYVVGKRSAFATERAAQAAEETQRLSTRQLESTVSAHEASTQPYVWVDLRPRDDGGMFCLIIGNSGPTVATEVRVLLNPGLKEVIPDPARYAVLAVTERLRSGLRSLAPGRVLQWNLGVAHTFFEQDGVDPVDVTVRISANGPYGPIPELMYVISLGDVRNNSARAQGLALLERPLERIAKAAEAIESCARRAEMRAFDDVSVEDLNRLQD